MSMKKLVEGFVHRPGVHCESSASRDVFEHHGFRFSEEMIFGLGSGLGFVYWKGRRMSYPFVGGRAKGLVENLCGNLGVALKVHTTSGRKKAYRAVRELIGRDTPVVINVDMPFLSYLGLPGEAHFGGHCVVVAGLDEEEGVAYVADTEFKELQKASLRELEAARASGFKPFPPRNRWFTFTFPEALTPMDAAIRSAIRKTVETMLYSPAGFLGVKGIRRFAGDVGEWPGEYPPGECAWLYGVVHVFLEEDGTGGGCFRYLYSRFLREVGEVIGDDRYSVLAGEYHRVGQKWTDVASLIRDIPHAMNGKLAEVKRLLLEIAGDEERALRSLDRLTRRSREAR